MFGAVSNFPFYQYIKSEGRRLDSFINRKYPYVMLAFIKDKSEIEKYQNNSSTIVKTYLNVRKSL